MSQVAFKIIPFFKMHPLISVWASDTNVLLLDNGEVVRVGVRSPHVVDFEVLGRLETFSAELGEGFPVGRSGSFELIFKFMTQRFLCVNRDGHCYTRHVGGLYYYGKADLGQVFLNNYVVENRAPVWERVFERRELFVLHDLVEEIAATMSLSSRSYELIQEFRKSTMKLLININRLRAGVGFPEVIDWKVSVDGMSAVADEVKKRIGNSPLRQITLPDSMYRKLSRLSGSSQVDWTPELATSKILEILEEIPLRPSDNVVVGLMSAGVFLFSDYVPRLNESSVVFRDTMNVYSGTWASLIDGFVSDRESTDTPALANSLTASSPSSEKFFVVGYTKHNGLIVYIALSDYSEVEWARYRFRWVVLLDRPVYAKPTALRRGNAVIGWLRK
uniref:2b protein n=1 Tax=Tobacco rattle virus TaxID=12295 RepID=E6Y0K1_9VIRU|nr:2b protein [Tobacco rattle virus]